MRQAIFYNAMDSVIKPFEEINMKDNKYLLWHGLDAKEPGGPESTS